MPDLKRADVAGIYHSPLLDLVYRAATVHREHHAPGEVQLCTLLSVKTGGCPEDCAYCPQAARYHTGVDRHGLLKLDSVLEAAREAREAGSTRFCMGAAWREVRDNRHFDEVLEMVSGVRELGLEVCCTLGMLTESQAERLREAGLYAYNHNLDSSREFYPEIIGTRSYDDRLETLANVHKAGLSVCCGGIIGMGETVDQRIDLLHTLATLPSPPESVPVNALVPVPGTPLEDCPPVSTWEMVRMIASARVLMPKAMVRLSAGRSRMSAEQQALCFLAGANSIFTGEKLLTTPNPSFDSDEGLLELLGLTAREPYRQQQESRLPA